MFFRTLRFRVTLLNVAVFGLTLLVFSASLYWIYRRHQAADFDHLLQSRALGIARSISINAVGQIEINQALIAESGRLLPLPSGNEFIEIRTPDGRSLARSRNLGSASLPMGAALLGQLQAGKPVFAALDARGLSAMTGGTTEHGDMRLRLLSMPLVAQGRVQLLLQLAVSLEDQDRALARLRTVLFFVGIPVTLLLAGAGGWWLAGRAFRPINRIVSAAQRIGANRMAERLPVPEADDELRRLSLTLNEMLGEVEKALVSQQRFVADASHEMKTPLTILLGELDLLRRQPRAAEEYRAFLDSAGEELQRLSQIIQNLLVLARADSGRPLQLSAAVRLDEVILGVMGRLRGFAEQAQVRCGMRIAPQDEAAADGEGLMVRGDADLLASLFFNLVHNAIKHSAGGQTVQIVLEPRATGPRVVVRDSGAGIAAADLPHLFERFHRAESPSRGRVTGTGLGLAIARWIAEAHGGRIGVESRPAEGSAFTVELPPMTGMAEGPRSGAV
jgi:hypothetical protein